MDPRVRRLLVPALAGATGLVGLTGTAALGMAAGGLAMLVSPRLVRRRVGRPHRVGVQTCDERVRLTGPEGDRDGWWGLQHDHGWCTVGPPDADGWRTLHRLTGPAPANGCHGLLHADLAGPDPSVPGLNWSAPVVAGPLGDLPIWHVRAPGGDGRDVAVFVHGRGGRRRNGLAMVPTFAAAGWDTRLVSYRNDEDAPSSGHYLLGGEWEDLAAVIDDLVEGGARRILLVGWSMGGNICASYLRHHGRFVGDAEVVGLMLDAPALSWRDVLTHVARQRRLPSALVPATLALGQVTVGIDWSLLDHVAEASHLDEIPVLIVHGDDDDLVPIRILTHLAEHLDDARLEIFAGGAHCRSVNADPDRYLCLLHGLLDELDGPPVPVRRPVGGSSWVVALRGTADQVAAA